MKQLKISGLSQVVDRAYNGLEAFSKVKQGFELGTHVYGLVLTDISMPVMDGYELSEEIRNYYRKLNVPQPMIVACTGHVEEEFIKKAWTYEIDEVISKPVNPDVLKDLLTQMT